MYRDIAIDGIDCFFFFFFFFFFFGGGGGGGGLNICYKFQVNIYSNNRDMSKVKGCHSHPDMSFCPLMFINQYEAIIVIVQ